MILDGLLVFDPNPTSVAIAAGTQASTNTISLAATGQIPVLANLQGARDMGIGDNPALKINCQVVVAFTSGGAGTLSVAFQGAPDNGSGAPGSFTTYYVSPVYALATVAVVGAGLMNMDVPRPPAGVGLPAYYRLLYTVAGATMTAGSVAAELVLDRQDWIAYPAGLVISN
jgi:hypothetical protein